MLMRSRKVLSTHHQLLARPQSTIRTRTITTRESVNPGGGARASARELPALVTNSGTYAQAFETPWGNTRVTKNIRVTGQI